jgi:hypothetical protein
LNEKVDDESPYFRSSCRGARKLAPKEQKVEIKLYKLKTCDVLKAGISGNQDRQGIARDLETLVHCLSTYSIAERQRFYPLLASLLADLPKTIEQPLFEDEAIYESSLRSIGYLCKGGAERIDLLTQWMNWAGRAGKSNKVGWGPILLAREAAKSLALIDDPQAISALRKYLQFEKNYFYERFPHLRDSKPSSSHHPWRLPRDLAGKRREICGVEQPLAEDFYASTFR